MASVPVLSASKTDEYQFNCKTLSREVRLYRTMHPSARPNHLVADSLFTSNKLLTDPYFFIPTSQDQHRVIATCYMVFHLCGHVGYVHGGVFARCASLVFESGIGMTASMNDHFQIPSIPDRADVYHAEITRTEGRKAGVTGQIRCVKELTAI
ncbi:HotDog domain-containing protein [Penicillium antarcticum]|uniref:HotDog domain-containing protein n=1 Tax=Penicillium antarcticum TaxID=416450 RepID=UPI00239ECF69|nr:HotDog domain-containing protein [Penicillium antarcticum]KAJ5312562.1 HotDog domain-containing protein [Penicillium antarcticum]